MELFEFTTIQLILVTTLGILFLIQLLYYVTIYNKIHKHNQEVKKDKVAFDTSYPPISVIICAKNESDNIRKNLPGILEQNYPKFEVIVINDGSTDESDDVLSAMEEKYPHLYHTFTPDSTRYVSRKKLALTLGIKASKYDWLVFTDANCYPLSKDWLKLMARNFTPATDIVLGYSDYEPSKKWFHIKVSFDNLFSAMRYLGYALIRKPYMGIGRNMAYRKEMFFKNKGFSSHLNLQKGDDDLFINEIATRNNTRVETSTESIMRMPPIEYRKQWKEEKVSYMATSQYYHGIQRFMLGFETFSRLLFYAACIILITISILSHQWILLGTACLAYIFRFIMQAVIINKTAKELGEKKYYLTLPIFDIIQPLWSFKYKVVRFFRRKGDFMRR